MFGEKEFKALWNTATLKWIEKQPENINHTTIPMVFFKDVDGKVISLAPDGKVIRPSKEIKNKVRIGSIHNLSMYMKKNGREYIAVDNGRAFEPPEYWYALFSGRVVLASRILMATSNELDVTEKVKKDTEVFCNALSFDDIREILAPLCDWNTMNSMFAEYREREEVNKLRRKVEKLERMLELEKLERVNLQENLELERNLYLDLRNEITRIEEEHIKDKEALERENAELKRELFEALTMLQDQPDQDNYNAWDIIGADPSDDPVEIRAKLMKAISLYHPDRVAMGGPILVKKAGEITRILIDLKHQLGR